MFSTTLEDLAFQTEKDLIAEYKTYVYGEGFQFGANFTIGGEGVSGNRVSLETRALLSKIKLGRKFSQSRRENMRKPHSLEHRKNQATSLKGHTVTCSICNMQGHNRQTCRERDLPKSSTKNLGKLKTCSHCQQIGHNKKSCLNELSRRKKKRSVAACQIGT